MPHYIGVSSVARKVTQPYLGVSAVARKVKNGYVGVSAVARTFYVSTASAVTNFAKVSKEWNKINFSWTNPSSNYTGVMIRANTGSAPTTTSTGTQVYLGVGTNTAAGATNTSGLVSLSISSNSSTTYYFSIWGYYKSGSTTYYSPTYLTTNAGLVCYNCSECSNEKEKCHDCPSNCPSDCNDWYTSCSCHGPNECGNCNQYCKSDCGHCGSDCGETYYTGCDQEEYPSCGKQTY